MKWEMLSRFYNLCYILPFVLLGSEGESKNIKWLSSGLYPQSQRDIATTKLIQCGMAEKPENKAFHGFCGCGFLPFWSAAALHGLFCPAILHLFLTIAVIVKSFKRRIYVHKEREKAGRGRVLHHHKGNGAVY